MKKNFIYLNLRSRCCYNAKLDKNFLEYTPLEFVRILKNKLKVKEIFVGFNFSLVRVDLVQQKI